MKLDDREAATVLAGMRLLQSPRVMVPSEIELIASSGDRLDPLDTDEIDALCERINRKIAIAVVDGDEGADIYGYASTPEEARRIASENFADPIDRVDRYGPICLANGQLLDEAYVAITVK